MRTQILGIKMALLTKNIIIIFISGIAVGVIVEYISEHYIRK